MQEEKIKIDVKNIFFEVFPKLSEDEFEWGPDEKRQVRFIVNENEEDSASLKWMIYFLTALALILTIMLLGTEDTIDTCLVWIILVPYLIFS